MRPETLQFIINSEVLHICELLSYELLNDEDSLQDWGRLIMKP